MVIAIGMETEYFDYTKEQLIRNCCINVKDALCIRKCVDGRVQKGTAWNAYVRNEIRSMTNWRIVFEVCMCIYKTFDLLVVLCKQGRHRSLTTAIAIAEETGAELVCHESRDYTSFQSMNLKRVSVLTDKVQFKGYIRERLRLHEKQYGHQKRPVVGLGRCLYDFDGPHWMRTADGEGERTDANALH